MLNVQIFKKKKKVFVNDEVILLRLVGLQSLSV